MRIRLLAQVADYKAGDVVSVSAEQGEKLVRTGYAVTAYDEPRREKGKAA